MVEIQKMQLGQFYSNQVEQKELKKLYTLESAKIKKQQTNKQALDARTVDLKITSLAMDFLYNKAQPVCSLDFVGYIFIVDQKKQINGMVDLFGNFGIFSQNPKDPVISEKLENKILQHMLDTYFLEFVIEPFPEFSSQYNLQIDPDRTQFIAEPLFKNFLPDDILEEMKAEFLEDIKQYVDSIER